MTPTLHETYNNSASCAVLQAIFSLQQDINATKDWLRLQDQEYQIRSSSVVNFDEQMGVQGLPVDKINDTNLQCLYLGSPVIISQSLKLQQIFRV